MAAMSFAVVGEGEDVWNTRERALKSERDESHPLRFGCPRNVTVSETIYLRGETWKAPQKLARKRKTDCVCAQTHRAPRVPYPFLSRIRIRISLKWDEKTEKKNSITFQKDASWCLKAHASKNRRPTWHTPGHDIGTTKGTPMLGHHRLSA